MGLGGIWQNMADCRQIAVRLPSDCRLVVGLWLLSRWKQVDVYKVSRRCPMTAGVYYLALYLARTNYSIVLIKSQGEASF